MIDLFASRLNNKVPIYFSEGPDPYADSFDAFVRPWPSCVYAFPPINLIGKFINRFLNLSIECGILVCPLWPSQPFFPVLLSILINNPLILPASQILDADILPRNLSSFLVCSISSDSQLHMAFLQKQLHASSGLYTSKHYVHTSDVGNSSLLGVVNDKLILAHLL